MHVPEWLFVAFDPARLLSYNPNRQTWAFEPKGNLSGATAVRNYLRDRTLTTVLVYGATGMVTGLLCFPPMLNTTTMLGAVRVPGGTRTLI